MQHILFRIDSAVAARATIKYLEQIDPKDHVLFLISGGGSSIPD